MFQDFGRQIEETWPVRLEEARVGGIDQLERGATWTYLTTDEPFGHLTERIMKGLRRMLAINFDRRHRPMSILARLVRRVHKRRKR